LETQNLVDKIVIKKLIVIDNWNSLNTVSYKHLTVFYIGLTIEPVLVGAIFDIKGWQQEVEKKLKWLI
jgi:hypothetical protein